LVAIYACYTKTIPEGAIMGGDNRVLRIVGMAALFYVVTLALDIAIGAVTGAPVNIPERARFWAIVAPFWSLAMEWFRSQTQQPARGDRAERA
jgi:hypothetical protein